MLSPTTPGSCPTCTSLVAPTITAANPVSIESTNSALTIQAAAVNVHGVNVVDWLQTMQRELQLVKTATVAQAQSAALTRTLLEARISVLASENAQLRATVEALMVEH
jgi:hypothetical protein